MKTLMYYANIIITVISILSIASCLICDYYKEAWYILPLGIFFLCNAIALDEEERGKEEK